MSQPTEHDAEVAHGADDTENTYDTYDVYDACIEVLGSGVCRAHLVEMPGCYALGQDIPAALAALEASIPAYYAWLRTHDEYTPIVPGPFHVRAKDTQHVTGRYPYVKEAFFPADATPVSDEDLDWLLALLEWSLDDLLRMGESLTPWERSMPTRAGSPPNVLLRQAAEIQARYLTMLNAQPNPTAVTLPDIPPIEQLREVKDVSLRRLRNVSENDQRRIFEVLGERWSLRKILRCGILSARMHADLLAPAASE